MSLGFSSLMSTTVLRIHEAADVIDVAVRVVAGHAAGQPEDVGRAEVVACSASSNLLAAQARVANLRLRIAVALLGGEQCAAAVHFDAAAFEHESAVLRLRVEQAFPEPLGRRFRHPAVLPPVGILGPGVEMEMHDGGFEPAADVAPHEHRAAVASPAAVGGMHDELDAARIHAGAAQVAAGQFLFAPGVDQHADGLARRNPAHHLGVDPANGVELVRPIRRVMRPCQPGGFVGLPFRGHREAEGGGCAFGSYVRNRRRHYKPNLNMKTARGRFCAKIVGDP